MRHGRWARWVLLCLKGFFAEEKRFESRSYQPNSKKEKACQDGRVSELAISFSTSYNRITEFRADGTRGCYRIFCETFTAEVQRKRAAPKGIRWVGKARKTWFVYDRLRQ